jgi:hypothetical protein
MVSPKIIVSANEVNAYDQEHRTIVCKLFAMFSYFDPSLFLISNTHDMVYINCV